MPRMTCARVPVGFGAEAAGSGASAREVHAAPQEHRCRALMMAAVLLPPRQDEMCLDTTFDEAAPATLPVATQFDSLLQKVSAAKGGAKMEAIAELFAALVQDRRSMHDAMITHMAMMLAIMQRLDDCEAGHFCRPQ
jgi:hypothetical protein